MFTNVSTGDHTITVIDTQGCTFLETTVRVIDYPKFYTQWRWLQRYLEYSWIKPARGKTVYF
ncbi:hypothetical protein [Flavobacterium sp.]|uniref:hypothetical protein n=1 Tax=Flavobacterium sp. TaxID=239 RepID=UPI003528C51A